MQEQYDRKKAELEQKLLREKAELAKVNKSFIIFNKLDTFSLLFYTSLIQMSLCYTVPSQADAFVRILQRK